MKILIVLSGGLDSAVATAVVLHLHPDAELAALNFSYGSRHGEVERDCARRLVQHFGINSKDLHLLDLPTIPKSWLTDIAVAVNMPGGVPPTYVPARNLIFLSYAACYALLHECEMIVCGIHATDAPYPDCTIDFIASMAEAIRQGTANMVTLNAPLIEMSKVEIVRLGHNLNVPFNLTWTCYNPQAVEPHSDAPTLFIGRYVKACGVCAACTTRLQAFAENNLVDPISYVPNHILSEPDLSAMKGEH